MVNTPLNHNSSLNDLSLVRPTTAPVSSTQLGRARKEDSPNDVSGRYSLLRQKKDRENNNIALPFCSKSKLPPYLEHDRRVLLFHAFYEEDVFQSEIEEKRIMKCGIYFYVEDGTIEIIQKRQENSGILHGVFLRRKRVEKPNNKGHISSSDGEYYEINDLKIGNEVEIYSRVFHIVDCNESTKAFVMESHDWHQVDVTPLPFPRDSFAEVYKTKMMRESGVPGVDRKRKMHDLKAVMEAMLGKQLSTADRGMFLECGQDALCFHAIWDDREKLYGDIQYYRLFYYLADDTIEILPIQKKNDGRYPSPKLLKRMKLPKKGKAPDEGAEYYLWKDLYIGKVIDVFGRSMQLATCDLFTTEHYKSHGIELNDNLSLEPKEEKIECVRQIPPYNGFGSEEDSLRSCTCGINRLPPKRDIAKMREKQGVTLQFNARLVADEVCSRQAPCLFCMVQYLLILFLFVQTNRRFVIQYFMEDDTIGIHEPPIRNSGVMGGKFLRRQAVKKNDGKMYLANDMYTGNVVLITCHHFELLDADEYSYRLMENDSKTFPFSCYDNVHEKMTKKKAEICKYFATDYAGQSKIDMSQLVSCCERVGLDLNKQQILTLWRKLDKKRKDKVSFTKLINLLES